MGTSIDEDVTGGEPFSLFVGYDELKLFNDLNGLNFRTDQSLNGEIETLNSKLASHAIAQ
jgi:hypothetical protein